MSLSTSLHEPTVAEFLSAGFKAGVPCRPLLDLASSRYGPSWFNDSAVQNEIVDTALDETPFRYGRREQTFLRLIVDEIDRSSSSVSERLVSAACVRASSSIKSSSHLQVQVGSSRIRVSSAFSDLGSEFG